MQQTKLKGLTSEELGQLAINTIRTLSIDAVQQANSGHPGTPMALAPLVYTIWNRVLRFDPQDPIRPNRDRFVLSKRPCLDAAVVGAVSDRHARCERGLRISGQAAGHAIRVRRWFSRAIPVLQFAALQSRAAHRHWNLDRERAVSTYRTRSRGNGDRQYLSRTAQP